MKKVWLLLILSFIALSACGPSDAEKSASFYATSDAIKTKAYTTKLAGPTSTPWSTPKPDTRSPFEQCVQSNIGVRYVITGDKTQGASITLENDTGGTEQGDFKVPYCNTLTSFNSGDFLYISAQNLGSGEITCQIYAYSKVIAQATSNGQYAIATCSTSLP